MDQERQLARHTPLLLEALSRENSTIPQEKLFDLISAHGGADQLFLKNNLSLLIERMSQTGYVKRLIDGRIALGAQGGGMPTITKILPNPEVSRVITKIDTMMVQYIMTYSGGSVDSLLLRTKT